MLFPKKYLLHFVIKSFVKWLAIPNKHKLLITVFSCSVVIVLHYTKSLRSSAISERTCCNHILYEDGYLIKWPCSSPHKYVCKNSLWHLFSSATFYSYCISSSNMATEYLFPLVYRLTSSHSSAILVISRHGTVFFVFLATSPYFLSIPFKT